MLCCHPRSRPGWLCRWLCRLTHPPLRCQPLRAAAVLLVSKRWHRVLLSEPALWRQLSVRASHHDSELALLRRVGGLVAVLVLRNDSGEECLRALACVQPQQLQALEAWCSAQLLAPELPRFSHLTRLDIGSWHAQLPEGIGAAILQLQQLRNLALCSDSLQQGAIDAVAASAQLSELSLQAHRFERPQGLRQLTRLRQLSRLRLYAEDENAGLYPPEPALLPALTAFHFEVELASPSTGGVGVQVRPACGGWLWAPCLASHAGSATRASNISIAHLPPLQMANCGLQYCFYRIPEPEENMPRGGPTAFLAIAHLTSTGRMPQLLSTLHPGGVPVVERLQLCGCTLDSAAPPLCGALASLTQLQLYGCEAAAGGWDAALGALLRHSPLLSSLHLGDSLDGALPPSLLAHTRLTELRLSHNSLQELPAGPYLSNLKQLSLEEDAIPQLPQVLMAAKGLTALMVERSVWVLNGAPAPLSTDGMAALLSQLPHLQRLQLSGCGLQQLPLDDWAGISALRSLNLTSNSLSYLPGALHQAASLRQLKLNNNPQLAPTAQQLGPLLSCLPLLEELELSHCGLKELPAQFPTGKQDWCLLKSCLSCGTWVLRCAAMCCGKAEAPPVPLILLNILNALLQCRAALPECLFEQFAAAARRAGPAVSHQAPHE